MKTTDYSKIAFKYDKNKLRHDIEVDANISHILEKNGDGQITVLDLACGTGNYLVKQMDAYKEYGIKWIGIDKSPDMLGVAKQKKMNAELILGDACEIPLEDDSVDYVKVRFAFHHFNDKQKALKEIYRILKKGGMVSIYNLSHDYMRHSWLYRYYPQVEKIDIERFPGSLEIFRWLDGLKFETQGNIHTIIKKFLYDDILDDAKHRDMSQLNLISDEEYEIGLRRIMEDGRINQYLIADISFLDFLGIK
jgi:ubiquinone/menaquinone biosynthesis C-methylase UbiE